MLPLLRHGCCNLGWSQILDTSPDFSTLEATAVDMDDPFTPLFDVGFDFCSGHGLVNAQGALQALALGRSGVPGEKYNNSNKEDATKMAVQRRPK